MDSEALEPMLAADLEPGAVLEQRHLDGGVLGDVEAADVELLECVVSDTQAGEIRLPHLRITGTTIIGSSVAMLSAPGATVVAGRLEGVRIGALLMDGADVSVHRIASSRIDVLSLRESKVRRLEIVDCQIGLLDLTGSRIRELTVQGGSIEELVPSRADVEGCDVSGTELGRILEPRAMHGLTLSASQAMTLGPDLAAHLGATVVD
ncbi:hypothetical protein [Demequina gelatinilytica]|uniref:hypothetical protein n=1 Tax=Demequina gelatinilytica TaxID=1638980 RepID=UPI000784C12E|nr:hypothetical protein [Demequina gelatinilytica]